MIIVTARARLHPGHRDAALSAAEAMRTRTLGEPGCIDYRFWSATDDVDAVLTFEQWAERSALDAHLAAPHTTAFLTEIVAAVDGIPEVTWFEVADHGPLFEQ